MISRRFNWLFDSVLLISAFFAAYFSAPTVQGWFVPSGSLSNPWVMYYLVPPAASGPFPAIGEYAWMLFALVPGTILFVEILGGYKEGQLYSLRILITDLFAPFLVMSLVTLVFFATKQSSWSRLFFFLVVIYSGVALVAFRLLLRSWRQRRVSEGAYSKNVLFIGSSHAIKLMFTYIRENLREYEYRSYGWLSLHPDQTSHDIKDLPLLGSITQLAELAVHKPIHEVICATSDVNTAYLSKIISDCDYFRLVLRIVPEPLLTVNPNDLVFIYNNDPVQLPGIVLRPKEINSDALYYKRLIDVMVSLILLLLLFPLFLIIAIAIKLTTPKLSVFYPWRVVGQNGVEFTGYKFTTMVEDADARKAGLMGLNEMSGPVFKMKNDPRVTWLGKYLRKFSLNELPQLWSVLKGDMSLVGPRPAGPHELVRYELWHKRKLCVQSGVTCLWQVRGRNKISNFDDWVRMDLEYIDKWSLLLDLNIIARTAWAVIRGTGS